MIEPVYSPKMAAYISVLEKIKTHKLKRGIFSAEYTKQVNLEIDGIRKRLLVAARRARTADGIRDLCEKDPQFAARWKRVKLQSAYINTFKRRQKMDGQLAELEASLPDPSDPSVQSVQSVTSEGARHAGQD